MTRPTFPRCGIAAFSILFLALSGIAPLLLGPSSSSATHSQCSDGLDNDRNGRTDFPQDFSCDSIDDNFEGTGTSAVFVSITDGKEHIRPGDSMIYIVSLLHQREDFKNVDVDLHVPAEVDLLGVDGGGRILEDRVVWDNVTLQKNITKKLTVQARVRTTARPGLLVVARVASEGTVATDTTRVKGPQVYVEPPFRVTVNDGRDFAPTQAILQYVITAQNLTGSDRVVRVQALVPASAVVDAFQAGASYEGHKITWQNVPFAPGELREFTFSLRIPERLQNFHRFYTRVLVDGVSAVDTTVIRTGFPMHALRVGLSSNRETAAHGDLITYEVLVQNTVPELATAAAINGSLPIYSEFVSVTEGGFWDGRSIHWRNIQIAPLGQRSLRYTVRVRADAPLGARLISSADADGAKDGILTTVVREGESVASIVEDDGTMPTSSERLGRVLLQKTADVTEVLPGGSVRYTVTVRNVLLHPIGDAVVTDRFNPSFFTVIDNGQASVISEGELEWKVPALAPGQTWQRSYILGVRGEVPHGTTMSNIAHITGSSVADASYQERVTVTQTGIVAELPSTGAPLDVFVTLLLFPLALGPALLQRRLMV